MIVRVHAAGGAERVESPLKMKARRYGATDIMHEDFPRQRSYYE